MCVRVPLTIKMKHQRHVGLEVQQTAIHGNMKIQLSTPVVDQNVQNMDYERLLNH